MPGILDRARAAWRAFAEPTKRPAGFDREVGIPGGNVEAGLSIEAYNASLQGPAWFRKVDEMRLASSQAAVIELCVTLPIVSAEPRVEGGASELRQLVETSLFGAAGMSTTWREFLQQACMAALYGTAVFEIVWKETPDGLLVRRLADRDPASIAEYRFDGDGGLKGVVQTGVDPDTDKEVTIRLPIEKLLLFPYRLSRRQYHGRSILRPAYRHYESIRYLCSFADIGLDHSLVGVPIGTAPTNYKPADLERFREMLSRIRRNEASGIVLPPGWGIVDGAKLGGNDGVGFLDYLQWHEGAFLRAGLCSFMQLGSTPTGTTELGGALMQFSLMAWSSLAEMILAVLNRHLVRRLCDYNQAGLTDDDYPEITLQPIREVFASPAAAGEFLGQVMDNAAEVPEPPAERAAAVREGLTVGEPKPRQRRAKAFAEGDVRAAVARVRADGAAARDDWQAQMTPRLEALLGNLLRQIDLAGGDPARIAEAAPAAALVADLGAGIAAFIAGVRRLAAERMADELGVAPEPSLLAEAPTAAELARGANVAAHLAEAARFEAVGGALRGEDLGALAARFSEAVDTRLRNDLHVEAQASTVGASDG